MCANAILLVIITYLTQFFKSALIIKCKEKLNKENLLHSFLMIPMCTVYSFENCIVVSLF